MVERIKLVKRVALEKKEGPSKKSLQRHSELLKLVDLRMEEIEINQASASSAISQLRAYLAVSRQMGEDRICEELRTIIANAEKTSRNLYSS